MKITRILLMFSVLSLFAFAAIGCTPKKPEGSAAKATSVSTPTLAPVTTGQAAATKPVATAAPAQPTAAPATVAPTAVVAPTGQTTATVGSALIGSSWDLVSIFGEPVISGTNVILSFDEATFSGNAGCNTYNGGYSMSGNKIVISEQIITTMMACEEGVMQQESSYLAALPKVVSYQTDGTNLTLITELGNILFAAPKNSTFEKNNWILQSVVISGTGTVSTMYDESVTMMYENGNISGQSTCNTYFATATVTGNVLTLGPVGSTKMACEPEKMQREAEFFTALAEVKGYHIDRNTLHLLDANNNIVITFAK